MAAEAGPAMVVKVFTPAEWDDFCANGVFHGSADDRRDGFIHLSTPAQLQGTLDRHFMGAEALVWAAFDPAALSPALRYEASRGGALFPHLYGPLRRADVAAHGALARDAQGRLQAPPVPA